MSKSALRSVAVILGVLIVVVLFAGLDDLPRDLRNQIDTEQKALAAARTQFQSARDEVTRDLSSDKDLFAPLLVVWPQRLNSSAATLQRAETDAAKLAELRQKNRRGDRDQVARLLAEQRDLRTKATSEAETVLGEARHRIDLKEHLPKLLAEMEQDYRALQNVDLSPATAAVQKAGADWPAKKSDLDSRLAALRTPVEEARRQWDSSAELRRKAAAGDLQGFDYAALFAAADALHNAGQNVPAKAQELKALTAQLYQSWDKILVDLDRPNREKIRTVRASLADASGQKSDITTDEKWVNVSQAEYRASERNLGMAIEHKSAGKYDFESEKVAQPAGFAYMAPPGQRNQYGYWDRRDGGNFWVWYGQYALLRDLFWRHDYRPLSTGDYYNYRDSQSRGQTYYGRDEQGSGQRYGTQGTFTQKNYKDSKYATTPGTFRSSPYASRGGDTGGKKFGSSRPSPSPSYRPSRPSAPRSFGGGGGRRFGGGGRRR